MPTDTCFPTVAAARTWRREEDVDEVEEDEDENARPEPQPSTSGTTSKIFICTYIAV